MGKRIGLIALLMQLVPAPCSAAESATPEIFTLTVTLQDVYNAHFDIPTNVIVDQEFGVSKQNGAVTNAISGVLHRPQEGRYPLTLTISEWKSDTSNNKNTERLNLELDKPWVGGPAQSFVYLRTVVLSKQEQQARGTLPGNSGVNRD